MAGRPRTAPPGAAGTPRILFVYNRDLSTFIERDWKIVQAAFPESRLFRFAGIGDTWSLRRALRSADLCLAWFGARHALLSAYLKPRRVPLVVVAGGYDVTRMPEMNYGSFAHFPQSLLGRRLFARADRVLAVSDYCAGTARTVAGVPEDRLRVVYHGFDPAEWNAAETDRTVDVLTISGNDVERKSLDLIFRAAALLPERTFEIVGEIDPEKLRRVAGQAPANVRLVGRLDVAALKDRLAHTRVYLQPSRHECFGCAVAEAMLAGCVPVVARATAQPEVVGDAGFYAEAFTGDAVAVAVKAALAAPESARAAARKRIETKFSLSQYRERFLAALNEVLEETRAVAH